MFESLSMPWSQASQWVFYKCSPESRSPASLLMPVDDQSTWMLAQSCCPHIKQAGISSLANGTDEFSTSSFRMGYKGEQREGKGSWKEISESWKSC